MAEQCTKESNMEKAQAVRAYVDMILNEYYEARKKMESLSIEDTFGNDIDKNNLAQSVMSEYYMAKSELTHWITVEENWYDLVDEAEDWGFIEIEDEEEEKV